MADEHLIRLAELTEDASPQQKAEILHELLTWFGDDEKAIQTIVDWADDADLINDLHDAVLAKLADSGP